MYCAGEPETIFVPKRPGKHLPNCAGEVCLACFVEMSFRHYVEKMTRFNEDPKNRICFSEPGIVSSFMSKEKFPCLVCTVSDRVTKKMMKDSGIYDKYLDMVREKISRWKDDRAIHVLFDIVEDNKEMISEYKQENAILEQRVESLRKSKNQETLKRKALELQLKDAGKMVSLKDQQIRFHIENNKRILLKRRRLDE